MRLLRTANHVCDATRIVVEDRNVAAGHVDNVNGVSVFDQAAQRAARLVSSHPRSLDAQLLQSLVDANLQSCMIVS